MKKFLSATLALMMVFSLCACGNSGSGSGSGSSAPTSSPTATPTPTPPAAKDADLAAFVSSLQEQYTDDMDETGASYFNANMDLTEFEEMFDFAYPGLKDIPAKQLVVNQPMMSAVVCEIALIQVENEADVEAVKTIFQQRIKYQVDGGAQYPDTIEGWERNSRIVEHGSYVMMIAWAGCDKAVAQFEDLFA